MTKQRTKDNQTAAIVKKVAEKWGFSLGYVYMIYSGTRNNQAVMNDLMELHEKIEEVFDNNFLKEVNRVSPFYKKTAKN